MTNHFGQVLVSVFDFEKALYFPGLPNDNENWNLCVETELNLFVNLWHRVLFFW